MASVALELWVHMNYEVFTSIGHSVIWFIFIGAICLIIYDDYFGKR